MYAEFRNVCITCLQEISGFSHRYRHFLHEAGTILTLVSSLLLLVAVALYPQGILSVKDSSANRTLPYLLAALSGSVYIWWSAAQGIRKGDFTADIPVSIATAAAIAIGEYSAAAVVAVLLLFGGMLESFVAARAGNALDTLARLLPECVTVLREGRHIGILLSEVKVGDIILVRPGERIAVDGRVISGTAAVNQSAITGESLPVDKQPGDPVFAGTLNEVGALEINATKVGVATTLGQIRSLVEQAQSQKAPIERLLNRYAKFYTPAAILLGGLLWWWTGDIYRAITVLIVFCPCVMVLATPTALVASIGNAALRGSMVKKGATIEALSKIDTIVFDKTGTLTLGKPRLTELHPINGMVSSEQLRLSAVAERFSEHPIGQAVVLSAEERGLVLADPQDFEALPGMGVRATVDGHRLLLGKPSLLVENGIEVDQSVLKQISNLTRPGCTVIVITVDQTPAGLFVFEDTLRPDASASVKRLHQLNMRTILLSGDNQATAKHIASALGMGEFQAEVLPPQKLEYVQKLQAEQRKVAFVGDGVNDGPALAAADVGIAMGFTGTDLAIETAEVSLLSDDLSHLPHLLTLSRQAMRAIRQYLAFSLAVLGIAIMLTTLGILMPVTGALLHELSSIPVIANSARLIGLKDI